MTSPTQRSLSLARSRGYTVGVVERWLPGVNIRYDYLGIIDLIAVKPGEILGIQSCGEANAAHLKKLRSEKCLDMADRWLEAGGRFVVWAWKRRRKNHRVARVKLVETAIDRAWVAQARLDARLAAMTPEEAGRLADLYAAGAGRAPSVAPKDKNALEAPGSIPRTGGGVLPSE